MAGLFNEIPDDCRTEDMIVHEGRVYVPVPERLDGNCRGCAFQEDPTLRRTLCYYPDNDNPMATSPASLMCYARNRSDRRGIIWVQRNPVTTVVTEGGGCGHT